MNCKLYELADIHSGVVLSRKEAPPDYPKAISYQRLTLRALSDTGILQRTELEQYYSREILGSELFTTIDDVVVRLCIPINPILIQSEQAGILIPSQLAAIRVKDTSALIPSFLRWYLSQKCVLDLLQAAEHGTAQRTIKVKSLLDLEIELPPLQIQKQVSEVDTLSRKREVLYQELILQERLHTEYVIQCIVGGNRP